MTQPILPRRKKAAKAGLFYLWTGIGRPVLGRGNRRSMERFLAALRFYARAAGLNFTFRNNPFTRLFLFHNLGGARWQWKQEKWKHGKRVT